MILIRAMRLYIISSVTRNSYLIVIVFRALRSTFRSDVASTLGLITKSNGGYLVWENPGVQSTRVLKASTMLPALALTREKNSS